MAGAKGRGQTSEGRVWPTPPGRRAASSSFLIPMPHRTITAFKHFGCKVSSNISSTHRRPQDVKMHGGRAALAGGGGGDFCLAHRRCLRVEQVNVLSLFTLLVNGINSSPVPSAQGTRLCDMPLSGPQTHALTGSSRAKMCHPDRATKSGHSIHRRGSS